MYCFLQCRLFERPSSVRLGMVRLKIITTYVCVCVCVCVCVHVCACCCMCLKSAHKLLGELTRDFHSSVCIFALVKSFLRRVHNRLRDFSIVSPLLYS